MATDILDDIMTLARPILCPPYHPHYRLASLLSLRAATLTLRRPDETSTHPPCMYISFYVAAVPGLTYWAPWVSYWCSPPLPLGSTAAAAWKGSITPHTLARRTAAAAKHWMHLFGDPTGFPWAYCSSSPFKSPQTKTGRPVGSHNRHRCARPHENPAPQCREKQKSHEFPEVPPGVTCANTPYNGVY